MSFNRYLIKENVLRANYHVNKIHSELILLIHYKDYNKKKLMKPIVKNMEKL